MWSRHSLAMPAVAGTFDYWVVEARPRPALEEYCRDWMTKHLRGYTGMLNIETIGGYIIEVHLRFADQWPDLNGRGWLDSVVRLYELQQWQFEDRPRRDGYSVVLFGPHGRKYSHPRPEQILKYRAVRAISSVQITFCENLASSEHSMPPGGFRLAVINTHNLDAGLRLRALMAQDFGIHEQGVFEDQVNAGQVVDEAKAALKPRSSVVRAGWDWRPRSNGSLPKARATLLSFPILSPKHDRQRGANPACNDAEPKRNEDSINRNCPP